MRKYQVISKLKSSVHSNKGPTNPKLKRGKTINSVILKR